MIDGSNIAQAIRGPIMLIVLGTLVMIDYAEIYSFWRTWPILIIVFGLLKLLERAGAKPAPPSYPPQYPGQYPGSQTSGPPPGGNVI